MCYNRQEWNEEKEDEKMTMSIWTFLIVCPLVFLAGFVDSVAGGGGVISLPAYLLAGLPIKMAAGTNKLAAGCGTVLSAYRYAKSGNVNWMCAIPAGIFSLIGSSIGTSIAVYMREEILQLIVLASLPLVAIFLFFSRGFGNEEKPAKTKQMTFLISAVIGFVIGMYDGLVGPGTGTFLTLAFCLGLGYTLLKSSGCARIANLASNIASMVIYIAHGNVVFAVGIPAMAFSMLGHYMGSRFAIKGGNSKIKLLMFVVLGLLFVKIGLNFFGIIDF